jgi:hypothetical protein
MSHQISLCPWEDVGIFQVDRGKCSVLSLNLPKIKFIPQDQALPQSVVNVVIDMDIRGICAQIVEILRSRDMYQGFIAARDDDAQQLLDLLQDVSWHFPLWTGHN